MGTQLAKDAALAQLAAGQEAMVSTAQMHRLGLSAREIHVRVGRGVLHRMHRGVYLVGVRRMTPRGRLWAAVLACGGPELAAISHLSAAAEWRMLEHARLRIDVTAAGGSRSTGAICVHRSLTLDPRRDLTRRHGLPITTPWRTLDDIAHTQALERAAKEAAFLGLLDDPPPLPLRSPRLRATVAQLNATGPQRTKSELERRFLSFVARHDLPPPLVNVPLLGYVVDFLWPGRRLVVETDGRNHLRPLTYDADRERDAILQLHGYRVIRLTWEQLDSRAADLLRRLLAYPLPPGTAARA